MVKPIKSMTLRQSAYKMIRDAILRNEYLPGQVLSIASLVRGMGISHTPIREAVVRLSQEGLLEYEPNKRLRVTTVTRADVGHVYQVRLLIEPPTAAMVPAALDRRAGLRAKLEKLHAVNRVYCRKGVAGKNDDRYAVDFTLNEIILEAADNQLLVEVMDFIVQRSMRIRTIVEATLDDLPDMAEFKIIAQEHMAIIEAMLGKDPGAVQTAAREHLISAEKRTLDALDALGTDSPLYRETR